MQEYTGNINSQKSIVVLPFVNMSTDADNEYFSDGITEEIINALTTIKGLKVIARTSSFAYKGKNIDVREIGKQLNVSTVLEGSVRKSGDRIRITAQLIHTEEGIHIWSQNFDRVLQDVFELQDEISLLIADKIRENFGHFEIKEHLISAPTNNIEAYNLYLKGRYYHLKWNAEDLLKGVDYYEQSIDLDPSFALPYFGAGLCYGINASWGFCSYDEGIEKAEFYLQKGLEKNKDSYLGHFAQATVYLWGKWNYKLAYEHLSRSLVLNPSFTEAEEAMAELYTFVGDLDSALKHADAIIGQSPLSPNHYFTKANIYYLKGAYQQALDIFKIALQLDPTFALAIEVSSLCYIQLGNDAAFVKFLSENPQLEKVKECRRLYQLQNPNNQIDALLGDSLEVYIKDEHPSLVAWNLYLNVYLGNYTVALDMLERGCAKKVGQFINFRNDPFLKPLHKNKRFKNLIRTVFTDAMLPKNIMVKELSPKSGAKIVFDPSEAKEYLQRLKVLFEEQELYLNASISLKDVASEVRLHPNKLSWLLNEYVGKNFNEYINSFRVEAFKTRALNPSNSHLTLLGLAYESGFNSKSVFNSFFSKTQGTTPSVWLKLNKEK
ncbi:helix-turn-helix domain-containing protein [Wenyingzhuangia sp. IMCC45574]